MNKFNIGDDVFVANKGWGKITERTKHEHLFRVIVPNTKEKYFRFNEEGYQAKKKQDQRNLPP
jgi:hypothetical protein